MSEGKLRTCSCCKSSYEFCPRCPEDEKKELWYFAFCSSNCHDIYDITSKFESGNITAIEAKSQLEKLDLSKLDNFGTSYKSSIERIIGVKSDVISKNSNEVTKSVEGTGVENNSIEEENNSIEENVFKKPRNRKAKNNVEE